MTTSIEDFWVTVQKVNGAYLDANAGFHSFREKIVNAQAQIAAMTGLSPTHLDTVPFAYAKGKGPPSDPDTVLQHQVPQGQLKQRNEQNGENALFLGAMSVVAIYQFWEDRFRAEIAAELGMQRDELKHNLLGDLRLIRIAIIHHRGIAKKEIEKCVLLQWFKEGDQITIEEDRMHELVTQLRYVCLEWVAQRQATNPNA